MVTPHSFDGWLAKICHPSKHWCREVSLTVMSCDRKRELGKLGGHPTAALKAQYRGFPGVGRPLFELQRAFPSSALLLLRERPFAGRSDARREWILPVCTG
jgi:hypothetical protein